MKSLMLLWKISAEEFADRCHTSAARDINNVAGRVKHEGDSFLTITLPAFGKDFQKSLDNGLVDRNLFQGFSWQAGLPRFLGGFLDRVFDRESGVLLAHPDIEAVIAIRQLTLMFSKILLPCSDARERDAMDGYVQCDREVKENDARLSDSDYSDFRRMFNLLFRGVLLPLDRKIYEEDVIPRHGPGATADKLHGNMKYQNRAWTSRLQEVFSSENFLLPNATYAAEDEVTYLEPGEEIPVKVISVPKTQKTPRIIAIEPTAMQYAQQAILEPLVTLLENSSLGGMIGFTDQGPNQSMACEGSDSGKLATLDLSEASDRVSNQLVRSMLLDYPHLRKAIEATRSRRADVPGHGVVRIAKYASMGSALCFPIEAMVFLTLIFLGIERELSTRFSTKRDLTRYVGRVRVYGDDLIVPVNCVISVIHVLEHFGARVGMAKSFWIGRFRESCGKEYYDGQDVSIVKVRRLFPHSRKDAPEVISLVSLRNQFYLAGQWHVVKWLDSRIWKLLKHFPVVLESSSVQGRTSFLGYQTDRMCDTLHAPLVKGYVVSSRLPHNPVDGQDALLKCFLKRGNLPIADRKHLERSGRPRSVDIKARWASPF